MKGTNILLLFYQSAMIDKVWWVDIVLHLQVGAELHSRGCMKAGGTDRNDM